MDLDYKDSGLILKTVYPSVKSTKNALQIIDLQGVMYL